MERLHTNSEVNRTIIEKVQREPKIVTFCHFFTTKSALPQRGGTSGSWCPYKPRRTFRATSYVWKKYEKIRKTGRQVGVHNSEISSYYENGSVRAMYPSIWVRFVHWTQFSSLEISAILISDFPWSHRERPTEGVGKKGPTIRCSFFTLIPVVQLATFYGECQKSFLPHKMVENAVFLAFFGILKNI